MWIKGYLAVVVMVINLFVLPLQAKDSIVRAVFPAGMELHSDDPSLSKNINSKTPLISTSVETVRLVIRKLGWRVQVLNVPFVRSLDYMDRGQPICIVNKIKTPERVKKYVFSLPLSFFESHRFYQLADLPSIPDAYLNEDGEITSIHALLNSQPESTILKPVNFSFGARIDNDLAQVNEQQIIPIENESYYQFFVKMFASKRSDYAVIFPLALYQNFGDTLPIDVRSYAIADAPDSISGRFMCNDTEQSRQLIVAVNSVLKTLYSDPEFIDLHTRFLPKENGKTITRIINHYSKSTETEKF